MQARDPAPAPVDATTSRSALLRPGPRAPHRPYAAIVLGPAARASRTSRDPRRRRAGALPTGRSTHRQAAAQVRGALQPAGFACAHRLDSTSGRAYRIRLSLTGGAGGRVVPDRRLSHVLKAYRYEMRRTTFVEVNSVERRRVRHGHVVVSDHQELTLPAEPRKHLAESPDVRVVESGVDLVEDRERTRVDLVEREHQRQSGE